MHGYYSEAAKAERLLVRLLLRPQAFGSYSLRRDAYLLDAAARPRVLLPSALAAASSNF
jgi:hypothetical protein